MLIAFSSEKRLFFLPFVGFSRFLAIFPCYCRVKSWNEAIPRASDPKSGMSPPAQFPIFPGWLGYSWIERPCYFSLKSKLSGCRKARINLRPATSVSERGASRSGLYIFSNPKMQKLTLTINMIPDLAQHIQPRMLSLSLSLFISTINQIVSSYKTHREFAFSPRPKSLAPRCARRTLFKIKSVIS